MKNKIWIVLFISAFLVLTGCRASPVLNIEEASIVTNVDNISKKEIAMVIKRAGSSLGWIMKDTGDGEITGILNLRKHMAAVSIKFNTQFYSIKYKDSRELGYDGTNIHKNYNGWIQNLDRNIQTRLSLL